ncbi:phosphoribosyltransferase family protein [Candidatus Pacebacteria bacterium]|nr:phosphoribosyltransferase family protein [Candidatus Paceibacterota bacterium]
MNVAHLLKQFCNLLFPLREDARLVASATPQSLDKLQSPNAPAGTRALLPFTHPLVRAAVHEVKFHDNLTAIDLLASPLTRHLSESDATVLVPIPLSRERQRVRGYNQVSKLVKVALKKSNCRLIEDMLVKVRDTKPQTTLSRAERLKNVADAFGISDEQYARTLLTNQHIIILDDVVTTGATLQAAKAALSPLSPASITCLALAH